MNRSFTAETWTNIIAKKSWYEAIDEATDMIDDDIETDIQGYDADASVLRAARRNAEEAGVGHLIHFQQREVKDLSHPKKYGFIITNPPYGERLEEKEALPKLYKEFGDAFKNLDSWSAYMITSYEEAERYFGRKADKNRKIYNGMLRTYFYQFQGPRPPRKTVREHENEAKALLMENELIKKLEPRYNILLKDDKTFPHLVIDVQSEFPCLRKYRGKRHDKSKYFGPFASVLAVNSTLDTVQKAFLLRTCRDSVFKHRDRPCLMYQIKRNRLRRQRPARCAAFCG